jgi:hypothetical protein
MRLRVGLLLCLFAVIAVVGCRKPMTPNVDRNKAPETWITAAPFDTITLTRGQVPQPGTIPIRFHVYWAGSDQDGAVTGYYWAVVETLPAAPEGGTPSLPGPRPNDYHYTTRSDSTFIFSVAEDFPDRQHAFFVYSVDDKGKPDPTPARFIFNAQDRFPPLPIFDEAVGIGTIYFFDAGGVLRSQEKTFSITDRVDPANPTSTKAPRDTVPSGSRLRFRYHAEIRVAGSVAKGYRYKLDEAQLQPSDPDSLYHKNVVEYHVPAAQRDPARNGSDTLAVATGVKIFTLRAVDQANGSLDSTRRFQMNFAPDTWFAGPDPDSTILAPWQTLPETGEKYALLADVRAHSNGLPGSLMSPESVTVMPVNRRQHKTFLEVYKDTVFLRREGDTVHLGSWVIIHNGGFDKDSPYQVHVADIARGDPNFPDGPVLRPDSQNGSPIGFRSLVTNWLSPNGPLSQTAQSRLYPFFDPNDVLHFPRIAAYHPMTAAGEAYSLQRAEDGDGTRDNRVDDARRAYLSGDPRLLPLIMVFQVDFPPVLQTDDFAFFPKPLDTFNSRQWAMRIVAADRDPFTSGASIGGPTESPTLRLRFKVTGKDTDGAPLVFLDPAPTAVQQKYVFAGGALDVAMQVPVNLASGLVTLTIELCDCTFCELNPGEGRCISQDIQVNYVAPPGPTVTHP